MTTPAEENIIDRVASELASEDQAAKSTTLEISLEVVAAAKASWEEIVGVAPFAGKITSITYTPEAEEAESSSEYRTFSVVNLGTAGTGTAVAAEFSTKTAKIKAGVQQALTLSATAANLVVAAGAILKFKDVSTEGKETKGGTLSITIARTVHTGPANNANQEAGFEGVE